MGKRWGASNPDQGKSSRRGCDWKEVTSESSFDGRGEWKIIKLVWGGGEGNNFRYVKTGEKEYGKFIEVLVSTESNERWEHRTKQDSVHDVHSFSLFHNQIVVVIPLFNTPPTCYSNRTESHFHFYWIKIQLFLLSIYLHWIATTRQATY